MSGRATISKHKIRLQLHTESKDNFIKKGHSKHRRITLRPDVRASIVLSSLQIQKASDFEWSSTYVGEK